MSKIGVDTGQLTDEELEYIEQRVIAAQMAPLIGRQVFAPVELPNAGVKLDQLSKRHNERSRIDMDGMNKSSTKKQSTLTRSTVQFRKRI
jgi:hypothetical protein